ncbi:hypothetical protein BC831DRAFT_482062 [Entophlyctis helioformis]|nr:hypothetical protein BC831DRAFT_482062 [Entophlyctis helioformis]
MRRLQQVAASLRRPSLSPPPPAAAPARTMTTDSSSAKGLLPSIAALSFTNSLTNRLRADKLTPGTPTAPPAEPSRQSQVPRPVPGAHFSYVMPTPSPNPRLLSLNPLAARNLVGLDPDALLSSPDAKQELIDVVAGNKVPAATHPWSLNYGGHQFGVWAGQLGDGRAIALGEVVHPLTGVRTEIQLKGAGLTPYSRFADGFAVLRSSIREYLAAEAMAALGAPTSRSLALISNDRKVMREEGNEIGAVVCRLAPSWIRFGSFELHYSRGEYDLLKELADYTIDTHFRISLHRLASLAANKYLMWYREVVDRTADMIAHWQAIGFCHGVMNTDNFSVLGLTIDYGPYQFMDTYEPAYICNHSDETGRYAFHEQPRMALWNLARLASVIDPLMASVLPTPDMRQMYQPLLKFMDDAQLDYTAFFRALCALDLTHETLDAAVEWTRVPASSSASASNDGEPQTLVQRAQDWYKAYRERVLSETTGAYTAQTDAERQTRMRGANPKYILRNHLVQRVIDKVTADQSSDAVDRYLAQDKEFGGLVPFSMRGLKCSCSS